MRKVFANELALWNANADSHLVTVATFGVGPAGIATIEAIALMAVNENWIPVETGYDAMLIDALTKRGASFVKSLRYNLAVGQPIACVVLRRDTSPPIAMYVVSDDADADDRAALDGLIAESGMESWVWDIRAGAMPALPI